MPRAAAIPVIGLFAGPGGLGEGFSAYRLPDGSHPFRIGLSIEKDPLAHKTLLLRAFFRQSPPGDAPDAYYDCLRGTISQEQLFEQYPADAEAAPHEAWLATLGEVSRDIVHPRIARAWAAPSPHGC